MMIFFIFNIASIAYFEATASAWKRASCNWIGTICRDTPYLSLHRPHSTSSPQSDTKAFRYLSTSAWSAHDTESETPSLKVNL